MSVIRHRQAGHWGSEITVHGKDYSTEEGDVLLQQVAHTGQHGPMTRQLQLSFYCLNEIRQLNLKEDTVFKRMDLAVLAE